MAPHSIWPRVMCISWMRAVTSLGTTRRGSASPRQVASVAAAESRRDESLAQRLLEAFEHIGAPARGGERDRDIAWPSQRLDLAGEDLLEAQIVGCCGEDGTVRGERQTGNGGPVTDVAHGELRREMLGIRSAAAVAGKNRILPPAFRLATHALTSLAKGSARAWRVCRTTIWCWSSSASK